MRWFALVCFLILLILAWRKRTVRRYLVSFIAGCLVGFVFDIAGVNLELWGYSRQEFLAWQYFGIVVPAWGAFGATINMVFDWYVKKNWTGLVVVSVGLLAAYELLNLITGSWLYFDHSMILVVVAWFPMVFLFRISYLIMVNRAVRLRFVRLMEN